MGDQNIQGIIPLNDDTWHGEPCDLESRVAYLTSAPEINPVTESEPAVEIPGFSDTDPFDIFGGSLIDPGMDAELDDEIFPDAHSNLTDWDVVEGDDFQTSQIASADISREVLTDVGCSPSELQLDAQTGPVISESRHLAMFSRDLLTNCSAVSSIVMPWEQGIFRDIFSDEPVIDLVPPMRIDCEPLQCDTSLEPQLVGRLVASATEYESQHPVFMDVISSKDDLGYVDKLALLRERALSKLLAVVEFSLEASSTGRQIASMNCGDPSRTDAFGILDAVVGLRSPYTLTKRANALMGYLHWSSRTGGLSKDPFNEESVWVYLSHLRESGASPTKGDSLLSSLRFARYVLGFDSLDPAINSRRLVGICELMAAGKRILKQAKVLQVSQVLRLHQLLVDSDVHICDRAICAYMLLALYGRCRHSDLQMIKSVECDFDEQKGGFVVVHTACHKTGRSAALKSTLLPIIIPARGVDGKVYAGIAINLLRQCGLMIEHDVDGPLLRAPLGVADFLQRGMTSQESSMSLRKLLGLPEPDATTGGENVSSHSLKATCLSWCAKRGLSPSSRSMLGRHTSVLNETFAIYSRDLMVAPAVELQKLIDEISEGTFSPDAPRSSFFATSSAEAAKMVHSVKTELDQAGNGLSEPVLEVIDVYDSGESSSDEEGCCQPSSDEDIPPDCKHRVKRYRPRISKTETWFAHRKSGILHKKDDETSLYWDREYLMCGKLVTDMYEKCSEAGSLNTLCRVCIRRS